MKAAVSSAIRLDKWLFHARFVRNRSLVASLVADRRVRINGQLVTKTHHSVRAGDVLTVNQPMRLSVVRVRDLGLRRGAASEAGELYETIAAEA